MWDLLRCVWARHPTDPAPGTQKDTEKDFFLYVGDAAGQLMIALFDVARLHQ
jgi:hypothetical protein